MIQPALAPVRPRVILPETNDTIPLDELLVEFHGRLCEGLAIVGGFGAGKSVALAHAAASLPEGLYVSFLDEPSVAELKATLLTCSAIAAFCDPPAGLSLPLYRLAPWTNDELLEYLLTRHPRHCGSVLRRITTASDRDLHEGLPELCRAVLDRMAEDEGLLTVGEALRREVSELFATPENLRTAESYALAIIAGDPPIALEMTKQLSTTTAGDGAFRLLRHAPVQLLLAAEALAAMLDSHEPCGWLRRHLPRRLLELTAALLTPAAIEDLHGRVQRCDDSQPMVASLLHASGQGWTPLTDHEYVLADAYLAGSSWQGLHLKKLVLRNCDLSESNFSAVVLEECAARGAIFRAQTCTGHRL